MGGTVKVESVVGEGSTFSITFKVMCKLMDNSQTVKSDSSQKSLEIV